MTTCLDRNTPTLVDLTTAMINGFCLDPNDHLDEDQILAMWSVDEMIDFLEAQREARQEHLDVIWLTEAV